MGDARRRRSTDLPWAFVFDASANLRALGDVQRQGLKAANDLIDRLLASLDGGRSRATDGVEPPTLVADQGITSGQGVADLPVMLAELAVRTLAVLTSIPGSPSPANGKNTAEEEPVRASPEPRLEPESELAGRLSRLEEVSGDRVEERLHQVGRRVRRAMLDTIPDGEPHKWLYRLVRAYPSRPAKALRPAMCLAACRAFGGDEADVFPVAVAIEMLHNAFLVHDDIVDGSSRRRGRPTLPSDHGLALSLNAGDALVVLANQVLRRHTSGMEDALAYQVLEEFDAMALRTLEGQATELGWQRDGVGELTPDDYLQLILHKTCWYTTIHPLRVGALIGSGGTADVTEMVRFGFFLGAAFQIRDDLLNLTGSEELYGKEINGDLREGKRTLALIHLVEHAEGGDRAFVDDYLRMEREARSPDMIDHVRMLLDSYGSVEFAAQFAQGIASAALDAFDAAFAGAAPGPDASFIRGLVPYMLGRRS